MISFKFFFFLLVSLSFVLMEENGIRGNLKNSRFVQKLYSEGTLVSDYSRTLDNILKKKFVEWLLNSRERKTENNHESPKRQAEVTISDARNQGNEAGSQMTKDLISWLLQNPGKHSLALPMGWDDWKDIQRQEFLVWLISADLCRPMTQ